MHGQFGDSHEYGAGVKWHFIETERLWLNAELFQVDRAPYSGAFTPYTAGMTGLGADGADGPGVLTIDRTADLDAASRSSVPLTLSAAAHGAPDEMEQTKATATRSGPFWDGVAGRCP